MDTVPKAPFVTLVMVAPTFSNESTPGPVVPPSVLTPVKTLNVMGVSSMVVMASSLASSTAETVKLIEEVEVDVAVPELSSTSMVSVSLPL